MDDSGDAVTTPFIPSDPLFPLQWYLHNTGVVPAAAAGVDINVTSVWPDYAGGGQLVAILDQGMDETHPDLIANYRADLSWDLVLDVPGSRARFEDDNHGVPVAGLIAADANNGIGVVGVAWDAQFIMYRSDLNNEPNLYTLFRESADKMLAAGADISNHSWGPAFPFHILGSEQVEAHATGRGLAESGRDGLGMVTMFAAGNMRSGGYDTNHSATTNMPWVIVVAASDPSGGVSWYSTPGANILVTAPGTGMVTTDRQGTEGYNTSAGTAGDYTHLPPYFNGTSASTPVATGVVALMLDANRGLGYRDVQEILAYSSKRANFLDREEDKVYNGARDWNGGALLASHDFGFGHIDAHAAVRLAESWNKVSTVSNLLIEDGQVAQRELLVPAGEQATAVASFSADHRVEHMMVTIRLATDMLEAVTLELISPDGTVSRLINRPQPFVHFETAEVTPLPTAFDYRFSTVLNWGETLAGDWTLRLSNAADGAVVHLADWSIQAHTPGTAGSDGMQIFTDEFARFVLDDAGRSVLAADNGHTLNAAAVTSDLVFDLGGGSSWIGDTTIQLTDPSAFRHLVSGDGNDILIGNEADNILMSGRGYNHVDGAAGLDVLRLIGEYEDYTVGLHADVVAVESHALQDGGIDYLHGVELLHFSDRVVLTHIPTLNGPDFFDSTGYLLQNPDVAGAVAAGCFSSGRQHYLEWGQSEGRNPNTLFSEAWYLAQNPDVAQALENGVFSSGSDHYARWGWAEGRAPSAWMDTSAYLQANPDVETAGVDPLLHYLQHGIHEGRTITALDMAFWG